MAKIRSFGTAITVGGNAVGGLTEITGPEPEANVIDVTNHGSANNSKEFIGGIITGGECSLSGFYDYSDVGQAYIRSNLGASAACVKTLSNGNKISFQAIISKVGDAAPLDESVPFTAILTVTGAVTRTAS